MPPLEAADPQFRHLSPQMSKILEQMQKGYYNFLPSETWQPNVNLYETEDCYVVCVDLAGVEKDKIDLELNDNRLTLKGARPVPPCPCKEGTEEPQKMKVHLMEIDHGSFARDVEIPVDVHKEQIKARYTDGMLWIELPKK
ncbi:MAG TPA: Hsp20/alpha crystallin family protein [Tepidisphaeraceae bacterium]|jgi:HSP20 family protein